MKLASLLILPLVLAACAPASGPAETAAPSGAGASPYAFEINLALTRRAAEKLAQSQERVIVDAMYFGIATSADAPGVDEHGMEVGLGHEEVEVAPDSAPVKVTGAGFDATYIASIKGAPEVLVNVFSARKTHENNLLDCGIYQGPVTMAQKKPVDIQCDLIEGLNEDGDVIVETGTPGQ